MSHAFDANLMFRTGAHLTADASLGPLSVYGGIEKGLAVRVVVEDAEGAEDTLLPKVYTSQDGSTYNLVAQNANGAEVCYGGKEFIVPFPVLPGRNYVKLELDGTATTFDFDDVYAGIIPNPGYVQERTSNWS